MNRLDTRRMRHDLHGLVDDFEGMLQDMTEATGDQAGELKQHADRQLRKMRSHLSELEHAAADRMRAAGRGTRNYASEHPWIVLGTLLAAALAVGAVVRIRQ